MLTSIKEGAKTFGYLFYATTPNITSFENVEDVPDYITEVVPFFIAMILAEQVLLYRQGKSLLRINDTIGSVGQGILLELSKVLFGSFIVSSYVWFYANFAIYRLPWDSPWTWFLCLIGVDFAYYWFHRFAHEVNIFWASHQVHHSSEDYNLGTALRQSVLQAYIGQIFYLPLGFCIPPAIYWAHLQLNTLFQFWIHTEVVGKLGPLEYIFNTPSHHRVHHGRNRYCIDKNYAGTLIIWDRIFGTFEAEEEEVVYGLTHNVETFDPFYIQTHHYLHIWRTFIQAKGFKHKLSVLFKGPGWEPGKPRLGNIEDIPDVHAPMPKYNPVLPTWCNVYVLLHAICIIIAHVEVVNRHLEFSQLVVIASILYLVYSLTAIGAIMDKKWYAPAMEFARCNLFFVADYLIIPLTCTTTPSLLRLIVLWTIRVIFGVSLVLWGATCVKNVSIRIYSPKKVQ